MPRLKPKDKTELETLAGSESEALGRIAVATLEEDKEARAAEEKTQQLDRLNQLRKFGKADYTRFLAKLLEKRLQVDWEKGWSFRVAPTNIGVVMEVYFGQRIFRQAFKATGEALYDLNAINVFGHRAETMIERYGQRATNPNHS